MYKTGNLTAVTRIDEEHNVWVDIYQAWDISPIASWETNVNIEESGTSGIPVDIERDTLMSWLGGVVMVPTCDDALTSTDYILEDDVEDELSMEV